VDGTEYYNILSMVARVIYSVNNGSESSIEREAKSIGRKK